MFSFTTYEDFFTLFIILKSLEKVNVLHTYLRQYIILIRYVHKIHRNLFLKNLQYVKLEKKKPSTAEHFLISLHKIYFYVVNFLASGNDIY